jgi:hypothetical protein
MKGNTNGLVCTFDRTMLLRTVGTNGIDGISKSLIQGTDFLVVEKLTTMMEINVFTRHGWGVLFEPAFEPVERSAPGDAGCAI